jgi:His/Glu/Gln/Arg/opine family amino acid ABC transporter permease subunit
MDVLMGWGGQLLGGALVTLEVAFAALVLGLGWGILGALAQLSRWWLVRQLGFLFTLAMRGTPELLIILIIYFGGSVTLTGLAKSIGLATSFVEIPAFAAGVFALSLVFGGYAAEVLRGAFLAIPKGQIEAAEAFGFSWWDAFTTVRLPQIWRFALPGLGNNWVSLIKDTSLVSVVGLEEIMRVSGMATAVTGEPFRFYLVAAVIFYALTTSNGLLVAKLERRASRGERELVR